MICPGPGCPIVQDALLRAWQKHFYHVLSDLLGRQLKQRCLPGTFCPICLDNSGRGQISDFSILRWDCGSHISHATLGFQVQNNAQSALVNSGGQRRIRLRPSVGKKTMSWAMGPIDVHKKPKPLVLHIKFQHYFHLKAWPLWDFPLPLGAWRVKHPFFSAFPTDVKGRPVLNIRALQLRHTVPNVWLLVVVLSCATWKSPEPAPASQVPSLRWSPKGEDELFEPIDQSMLGTCSFGERQQIRLKPEQRFFWRYMPCQTSCPWHKPPKSYHGIRTPQQPGGSRCAVVKRKTDLEVGKNKILWMS